jgi:ATP-dependent RNA helicase DeaD
LKSNLGLTRRFILRFEDFSLSESILRAVKDIGLVTPTPIQQESIPSLLKGRDLIGQAQTGTGKTFAFAIPIVERINPDKKVIQAVVITPTRELAIQVGKEFEKVCKYKRVFTLSVYGGEPIQKQITQLKRGVHIVVGTPGRIIDHIRRGTLSLKSVKFAVLDEADRMLDMGFIDDMKLILALIPQDTQVMMFSATIPPKVAWLAKRYMKDPVDIRVSRDTLTVPETRQIFYEVREFDKLDVLCKLIESEKGGLFLVFRKTKSGVDELSAALITRGYNAQGLHGDYPQNKRNRIMKLFRNERVDILVATDVAARGLHVSGITHVVNYDVPEDPESYIHRIGRTGRAGKEGIAITFITHWQYSELRRIQALSKVKIKKASIPILVKYTIQAKA